jgi:hypothetical protein
MGKKRAVNKSQAVRDFVRDNPAAGNIEIAKTLTAAGIKITANYVANIKGKAKMKRKARKKAAQQVAAQTDLDINQIKAAFGLLKLCGSTAAAKAALAAADDIKKVMG